MNWESISVSVDALDSADRCRIKDWGQKTQEEKYAFLTKRAKDGLKEHTPIVNTPKGKIILARICQGVFGCFVQDRRDSLKIVLNYLVTDKTLLHKLEIGVWTL